MSGDQVRKNQAVLAERQRWPEGALQACWDLMDRNPGWHVSWMDENITPGWERPAGFWATYRDPHARHHAEAFYTDAEELGKQIADQPPPHDEELFGMRCAWCHAHPGQVAQL